MCAVGQCTPTVLVRGEPARLDPLSRESFVCLANVHSVSLLTNCFASHSRHCSLLQLRRVSSSLRICESQRVSRKVSTLTLQQQSVAYLLSIDNRTGRFRIGLAVDSTTDNAPHGPRLGLASAQTNESALQRSRCLSLHMQIGVVKNG